MEGQRISKKPASSAYAGVFGGPARFAASPFPARLDDYVDIFGASASSCSIPFLDLPPATDGLDGEPPGFRNGPGFDYSEVFGGLEFGGFAVSYEELFSSSRGLELGSTKQRYASESLLLVVFVECYFVGVAWKKNHLFVGQCLSLRWSRKRCFMHNELEWEYVGRMLCASHFDLATL